MSQAPATPKSRRASRLLRARLGMSQGDLLPSERAALALREKPAEPPVDPTVVFLLPLVGAHHVTDPRAVAERLTRTLESFRAQTDPQWRAVVCSQENPGLPEDDRISFLPFTDAMEGNDKWAKLDRLCRHLPDLGPELGYVMPFDADDLLHPGAVEEMRKRMEPGGYLVTTGYVRDVASGIIGRAAPPSPAAPLRKPFWKLCGSCAAFATDLRDARGPAFLAAATAHEHRMFPYLARLAGRPLSPLSRPSVLYELNHGENFGARRGRVGFKTRFTRRFAVTDRAELARIAEDFAL
ncbi:glycosyltransferase family A protein [Histidinibacterium aquaticum]|uniref:Glycosyltransferase family 2 protein n=1 Tax=Histidinibacterium aquaticum TaxID=2613962 RepID=A0A5J5GP95_9RHOB|nr:glycosyltransferase family A protein [Histidinibacterium aquaticum]KAA9010121.1 glycosyltransferase family 2 protein [Histidinibacterium aquaticum]